ncbi:MAG: energy transducer TonB, partial [Rikenellaceae bacterium]
MSFGDWIYKNKLGVSALVIVFIGLFFAFLSVRLELTVTDMVQGFFVELPPEEVVQPEEEEIQKEEEKTPEQIEREMYNEVKNVSVNKNAKLDAGLKDDKGTKANDIYKEAQALQDRLNASRSAYEKGMADAEAVVRPRQSDQKKGTSTDKRDDSNVKGKVTVSYDLGGRRASHLPVPAYKCEVGGEVVINITVNHNGDVIAAEVSKTTSQSSSCLNETALTFARQSRFEIGSSWPEKHKGTISYIFLNQ